MKIHNSFGVNRILGENGRVATVELVHCLSVFDEEGRFNPEFDKECEQIIEGEQVYIAIGQSPDYDYLPASLSDKLTITRGKIEASELGQVKDVPWLFVGGDILRGPDLISGVADGHRSAQGIDDYLFNKAKKKEISKTLEAMRKSVKDNTPRLTYKQK